MADWSNRFGGLDRQEAAIAAFINHPEVEACYCSCERDSLEEALAAKAEELTKRGEIPGIFSPKEYADNFISGL
jgi:hypothetical protein